MASVRAQILAAVEAKLQLVLADLAWTTFERNPRERFGDDQLNVIMQIDGGDREPAGLTGHVEERWLDLSVGWMVIERAGARAEDLLDAGYSAIVDALLDPADIQLGGLAVDIRQGAVSDPLIGRSDTGARIMGGQSMDFSVRYWAREGEAASVAP